MTDIIGIMRPKKNNNEISSPPTITPTSFPSSSEGGTHFRRISSAKQIGSCLSFFASFLSLGKFTVKG